MVTTTRPCTLGSLPRRDTAVTVVITQKEVFDRFLDQPYGDRVDRESEKTKKGSTNLCLAMLASQDEGGQRVGCPLAIMASLQMAEGGSPSYEIQACGYPALVHGFQKVANTSLRFAFQASISAHRRISNDLICARSDAATSASVP